MKISILSGFSRARIVLQRLLYQQVKALFLEHILLLLFLVSFEATETPLL